MSTMADSHSFPVQSKSPTSIQSSIKEDYDTSEAKLSLELVEALPWAPPKIDINALKNEILTDGMQVSVTRELASYSYSYNVYSGIHISLKKLIEFKTRSKTSCLHL